MSVNTQKSVRNCSSLYFWGVSNSFLSFLALRCWGWAWVFVRWCTGRPAQNRPPGNVFRGQKRSSFSPKWNYSKIMVNSFLLVNSTIPWRWKSQGPTQKCNFSQSLAEVGRGSGVKMLFFAGYAALRLCVLDVLFVYSHVHPFYAIIKASTRDWPSLLKVALLFTQRC